jgi:titin
MRNKLLLLTLFILILALAALLPGQTARADTYEVTNTNDSGQGSLRWAIIEANNHPGADTIEFAIPASTDSGCDAGSGVCTIQPATALPLLSDDITTIDGYSQDGASPATDTTPAIILIQIDGSSVANNNGFNIASSGNMIKGLAINRFPYNGIATGGSTTTGNVISGNYIGMDPSSMVDLGNGYNGVFIGLGAKKNIIGGDEPAERNVISGNEWAGIEIHGSGTSDNTVSGNYIGISADGMTTRGNTQSGVRLYGGTQNNLIGGDTAGERNVISGNLMDGVRITNNQSTSNVISGNYIGIAADGVTSRGNQLDGVYIFGGAQYNIIGGDTPGERNVISGNGDDGIEFFGGPDETANNTVLGNYIGVDASGLSAIPNNGNGIYLYANYGGDLIGGDSEGERNIISGNLSSGIILVASSDNEIVGNYIGLDASGLAGIPNGGNGISLWNDSRHNTIGGGSFPERNYISGNDYGIRLESSLSNASVDDNWIRNNVIGLTVSSEPLGNTHDGVYFGNRAFQNTVGPGNIIANNGRDGVRVHTSSAYGNIITKNQIFENSLLGINLVETANNGIAAPVILSAPSGPGEITGTACVGCTVEVFSNENDDGEGQYYKGTDLTDAFGNFSITVPFMTYLYLTATATETDDGTSEFSLVYTAQVPVLLKESIKSVDKEFAAPGELLTYAITLTNTGNVDATARMTDTLSSEVTWVGEFSASSGTITWEEPNNRLLWQGIVGVGGSVLITFQVSANEDLIEGEIISNEAFVNNGAKFVFNIHAQDVTVVSRHLFLPIVLR